MKAAVAIVLSLVVLLLLGCCQTPGHYEKCMERGGALCIEFAPKCKQESSS